MKTKFALIGLVSAAFAAAFAITSARADIYPDRQCVRACYQVYNLCLQNSPAPLCNAAQRQCLEGCGVYL